MRDSAKEYILDLVTMKIAEEGKLVTKKLIGDLKGMKGKWGNWCATETVSDALDLHHSPVITLVSVVGGDKKEGRSKGQPGRDAGGVENEEHDR